VANGSVFVAVGSDFVFDGRGSATGTYHNAAFLSQDGEHWDMVDIDAAGTISRIATNGVRYVALGDSADQTAIKVFTSTDGYTWDTQTTNIPGHVTDVMWDGSRFVAVGFGLVISSANGHEWAIDYSTDSFTPMQSIAWNGERYVVVGTRTRWGGVTVVPFTGSNIPILPGSSPGSFQIYDALISTSENAAAWSGITLPMETVCVPLLGSSTGATVCDEQTVPAGLSAVDWNGSEFVGLGLKDVTRSVDGLHWTTVTDVDAVDISDVVSTPAESRNLVPIGLPFSLQPYASDRDGDSLHFEITGLPAWADFDTASGMLTGTPGSGDIGTTSHVTISVNDGHDTSSLSELELVVVP
jgi:hypothetical protein